MSGRSRTKSKSLWVPRGHGPGPCGCLQFAEPNQHTALHILTFIVLTSMRWCCPCFMKKMMPREQDATYLVSGRARIQAQAFWFQILCAFLATWSIGSFPHGVYDSFYCSDFSFLGFYFLIIPNDCYSVFTDEVREKTMRWIKPFKCFLRNNIVQYEILKWIKYSRVSA